MGVPGFQTWFRREYPNGYRPVPPNKPVDHLYWDLPGTLHSVLRRSPTRTSFYQNLRYRVLQVLRTIQPRKRVVFAMDGPAPLAKLQEQRRRRTKLAQNAMEDGDAPPASEERADVDDAVEGKDEPEDAADAEPTAAPSTLSQRHPPRPVDVLELTTGVAALVNVRHTLVLAIAAALQEPGLRHLRFELSDSCVEGEGELKILSRLVSDDVDKDTHVVIGGDSDLLLMCLAARARHVFLLSDVSIPWVAPRHSPATGKKAGHVPLFGPLTSAHVHDHPVRPASPAPHPPPRAKSPLVALPVFSKAALVESWLRLGIVGLPASLPLGKEAKGALARHHPSPDSKRRRPASFSAHPGAEEETRRLALDLQVVALLGSGNDYLPPLEHVRLGTRSSPGLWHALLALQARAWRGPGGRGHLWREREESVPGPNPDAPSRATTVVRVRPGRLSQLLRSCRVAGSHARRDGLPRLPSSAREYLAGLEWVLNMYRYGTVDNYRFSYDYHVAPSFDDLVTYLDELDEGERETAAVGGDDQTTEAERRLESRSSRPLLVPRDLSSPRARVPPLLPLACAIAQLPSPASLHLPPGLRHLMRPGDDTALARVYRLCPRCRQLSEAHDARVGALHRARAVAEDAREESARELSHRVEGVERAIAALLARPAADSPAAPGSLLERATQAVHDARALVRDSATAMHRHALDAHPDRTFPVGELERGLAAVDPGSYGAPFYSALGRLGRELLLAAPAGGGEGAEDGAGVQGPGNAVVPPPLSKPAPALESDAGMPGLREASPAAPPSSPGPPSTVPFFLRRAYGFWRRYPGLTHIDWARPPPGTVMPLCSSLPPRPYMTSRSPGSEAPSRGADKAPSHLGQPRLKALRRAGRGSSTPQNGAALPRTRAGGMLRVGNPAAQPAALRARFV